MAPYDVEFTLNICLVSNAKNMIIFNSNDMLCEVGH